MTKAGLIYLQIAEDILAQDYPNMDESTKHDLIARGELEELEEIIEIVPDITQTLTFLSLALGWRRKPVPSAGFLRFILTYDPSHAPSTKLRNKLGSISPEQQGEIALEVARNRHTAWVQDHAAEFGRESTINYWYLFMPIEMIGWEAVKRQVVFIRPLMIALGMDGVQRGRFHSKDELTPDADYLREAYRRAQRRLKAEGSITSVYAYSRFLRDLPRYGYSLHDEISWLLRNDEDVLVRVAAQVLQHNPHGTFCQTPRENA